MLDYAAVNWEMRQIANPIKLSRTKAKTIRQAPALGEHNKEIFDELGYTQNTKE
ncbi:hypothetical protein ABE096_17190 [Robertmurraya massiliosenegalensis]|uniref:hypothetical protein n=1 Tax=Robertmurraya TaxID=2837507 RepID=UPI0039A5E787